MRCFIFFALSCAACTAADSDPLAADGSPTPAQGGFATQIDPPTPDYRALIAEPIRKGTEEIERPALVPLPADAKALGDEWAQRLDAKGWLGGMGLAGKTPDGAIRFIDVLAPARDFNRWVAANGWTAPRHIEWRFQAEMIVPAVAPKLADRIRIWPGSPRRTGMQNMAALYGKVFLRDGCFFVKGLDGKERLAWFLGETGIATGAQGYLVLLDRVTGQVKARVGEEMIWAGPNAGPRESEAKAVRAVCGPGEIAEVGNPEAKERFYAKLPNERPVPVNR